MFSVDWLTLREPADFASRSAALTREVVGAFDLRQPLRSLDLAAGTGANVRYVVDHVNHAQHWLLVDNDPGLLARLPQRMSAWAVARGAQMVAGPDELLLVRGGGQSECSFATRQVDLRVLDDPAIFSGRALVTASALLDLVSEPWLRALADRCCEAGARALFALTYDGRIRCSPAEPEDEMVRQLVNRHQRLDKGFGPALGPDAVAASERCFAGVGYLIERDRSDWVLSSGASELQRQLIDGWAAAATAMAADAASIEHWRTRRLEHVDEGRSQILVGHEDLIAWPK